MYKDTGLAESRYGGKTTNPKNFSEWATSCARLSSRTLHDPGYKIPRTENKTKGVGIIDTCWTDQGFTAENVDALQYDVYSEEGSRRDRHIEGEGLPPHPERGSSFCSITRGDPTASTALCIETEDHAAKVLVEYQSTTGRQSMRRCGCLPSPRKRKPSPETLGSLLRTSLTRSADFIGDTQRAKAAGQAPRNGRT